MHGGVDRGLAGCQGWFLLHCRNGWLFFFLKFAIVNLIFGIWILRVDHSFQRIESLSFWSLDSSDPSDCGSARSGIISSFFFIFFRKLNLFFDFLISFYFWRDHIVFGDPVDSADPVWSVVLQHNALIHDRFSVTLVFVAVHYARRRAWRRSCGCLLSPLQE